MTKHEEPNGELYKIQFTKVITLFGQVFYDEEINKYIVITQDGNGGENKSYIYPDIILLLENANEHDKARYERYKSNV